ncbi:hypothetical protein [Devosia sp. RR2S18]|uniref:hypothetical protein n=1 Tax=Devosia rhizosphaerae TaxID=3049774 RepID=UPI0025420B1C|nr:hypothetical protein [Devosia sp. RR2S18]WIJ24550.1 hypothetical protein QOV41_16245 [Devosia sp. RR2S18]
MNLPDRHMLLGMTIGAICATALAATGPGMVLPALGDDTEMAAPAFDPANLVRFQGEDYHVEHEDWVATDPLSTTRVKKVEAGRVSYVTITTTATGTYSTDAMFSDHVQYAGISVEPQPVANQFALLSNGSWQAFSGSAARQFLRFRSGENAVTRWGNQTCVSGRGYNVC